MPKKNRQNIYHSVPVALARANEISNDDGYPLTYDEKREAELFQKHPEYWGGGSSINYRKKPVDEIKYRAEIFHKEGKYLIEIEYYKKNIRLFKNEDQIDRKIGIAYHYLGNFDKAIEYYKLAIRKKRNDVVAYLNLANAYKKIGNGKMAIVAFYKAGLISFQNMDKEKVLKATNGIIEINPDSKLLKKLICLQRNE